MKLDKDLVKRTNAAIIDNAVYWFKAVFPLILFFAACAAILWLLFVSLIGGFAVFVVVFATMYWLSTASEQDRIRYREQEEQRGPRGGR